MQVEIIRNTVAQGQVVEAAEPGKRPVIRDYDSKEAISLVISGKARFVDPKDAPDTSVLTTGKSR